MAELARFQNFAKLKDTEIEFNDITVLAGKPSTGKSYVMKVMYSIHEAFHKLTNEFENLKNKRDEILEKYGSFEEVTKSKLEEKERIEIISILEDLLKVTDEFKGIKDFSTSSKFINYSYKNIIQAVFVNLEEISSKWEVSYFDLRLFYENNDFKFLKKEIPYTNTFYPLNNIFVETPLIIEFHKHLDRRKAKTPYHIESLINILDEDYSFTNEEQDKFIKEFSQKVNDIIGGDIKSRNGSFVFSRNGDKDYNIFNASSGTKSIGLLQYLVTNKALKKGSVLFWEEPEVHLHPSWQLKMVDLFVELMNAGVKIVFSTHSPYMADYLNAISKRNGYRDRISFNVLDEKDGVVTNHILDDDNWDILQKELMDTFEDILWQYL